MSSVVRRAAPLAALLVCALPAPAAHSRPRGDVLVAQIAQATPAPAPGDQPPLTAGPPVRLGTATPTPAAPLASPSVAGGRLARTGSDAGLLALVGVGLLGVGVILRRAAHGAAR